MLREVKRRESEGCLRLRVNLRWVLEMGEGYRRVEIGVLGRNCFRVLENEVR